MKRVIALILITLLVVPPASASEKPGKPIDWQKARTLEPGTEVILTMAGGQPTKARLLFVDEAMIVTLKTTAPKLPGPVKQFLFEVGPLWPRILNSGDTTKSERVQVSQDGILDRGKKVAELSDVVQQMPRTNVSEISEGSPRRVGPIIIAALLTAVIAGLILGSIALSRGD